MPDSNPYESPRTSPSNSPDVENPAPSPPPARPSVFFAGAVIGGICGFALFTPSVLSGGPNDPSGPFINAAKGAFLGLTLIFLVRTTVWQN